MNVTTAKSAIARHVLRVAFALASLVTVGRVLQLAWRPQPAAPECVMEGRADRSAAADRAKADAELAELYAACPMAAVIDLKTVSDSNTRPLTPPRSGEGDELMPAYRQLAHRELSAQAEPAIPRIRYPVAVHPQTANSGAPDETVRVAQAPPAKTTAARGADWLIDPNEWYSPEEQAKTDSASPPAPQGNSDVDPATKKSSGTSESRKSSAANVQSSEPSTANALDTVAPPGAARDEVAPLPPPTGTVPAPSKPLFSPPAPVAEAPTNSSPAAATNKSGIDPHLELFAKDNYPSARECAKCHEEIYNDWSISAHAYAAVSPMFHKFEQKLNDLSQGTLGYFCMRCHAPVATNLCISRAEPVWNMPEVAREGITCVACHRVQYPYGKSNGERRIETGDIFAPVLGGIGGDGVADAIHRKAELKLRTQPGEPGPGQNIHNAGLFFEPLTRSEFCTPCHQVAVQPGIKLEVVWEQYRASPACKKGIQCQDCHMGRVPGLPQGYDCGPIARVNDKTVNNQRKKSNHVFFGPNYPIAHPGIFPFHLKADRWTMDQWLTFDWRAGWGTSEFENRVADGEIHPVFPPVWAEADDRADAREIIEENLKKIARKRDLRVEVMNNGSHVDGPFFDSALCRGQDLNFHYIVTNTNEGHNLLTASLGAQPQLWANVALMGPDGCRLWESGYTDSCNDLANIHSVDVRQHRAPYDFQLFNLQTMFLIQGATGTDREFLVPVNVDFDQLPFIRPGVQPITTLNHPPTIRMESRSLAPLGSREARYHVPGKLLQQPGTYRLSFRMRSRSEPMYLMRFVGATPEMERAENEWMIDLHPNTVEFIVR
jgi:hypothetical protein